MYGDNRDLPAKIKTKYHRHTESLVDLLCETHRPPCKIVDIGTRDGYAVELLSKSGYDVIGTDLIPSFVLHAKEHGRNVIEDDIMRSKLPESSFDVVLSRHCIEHCSNPDVFVSEAARILKPAGCLFMTFPLESPKERAQNRYHLCHFENKDMFRRIAEKHFDEITFCKSKSKGLITDRNEVFYHGRKRQRFFQNSRCAVAQDCSTNVAATRC